MALFHRILKFLISFSEEQDPILHPQARSEKLKSDNVRACVIHKMWFKKGDLALTEPLSELINVQQKDAYNRTEFFSLVFARTIPRVRAQARKYYVRAEELPQIQSGSVLLLFLHVYLSCQGISPTNKLSINYLRIISAFTRIEFRYQLISTAKPCELSAHVQDGLGQQDISCSSKSFEGRMRRQNDFVVCQR